MTASLSLPLTSHRQPHCRPTRRRPSFKLSLRSLRQAYAQFAMLDLHR
jgi:hypothetical protein